MVTNVYTLNLHENKMSKVGLLTAFHEFTVCVAHTMSLTTENFGMLIELCQIFMMKQHSGQQAEFLKNV